MRAVTTVWSRIGSRSPSPCDSSVLGGRTTLSIGTTRGVVGRPGVRIAGEWVMPMPGDVNRTAVNVEAGRQDSGCRGVEGQSLAHVANGPQRRGYYRAVVFRELAALTAWFGFEAGLNRGQRARLPGRVLPFAWWLWQPVRAGPGPETHCSTGGVGFRLRACSLAPTAAWSGVPPRQRHGAGAVTTCWPGG